jgi:hypothetical protein
MAITLWWTSAQSLIILMSTTHMFTWCHIVRRLSHSEMFGARSCLLALPVRGVLKRSGCVRAGKKKPEVRVVLPGLVDALPSKIMQVTNGATPGRFV